MKTRLRLFALMSMVALGAFGQSGCSSSGSDQPQDQVAPQDLTQEVRSEDLGSDTANSDIGLPEDASDLETSFDTAGDAADTPQDTAQPPRLAAYECLTSPDCHRPMVAAHRGDHIHFPECSLAGIRGAAALGADFVELDTRPTADGVIVLMHDSSVDRTTDGTGEVSDLTFAQIQALTLVGADPENPETHKVPTFEEALTLAQELGLMVYVDQKTGQWPLVVDVIRGGGFEKVALVRDDLNVILEMAPTCQDLLLMPATETVEQVQQALAAIPDLTIVELSYAEAKPDFVQAVHALGVKVQQDVMATGDTFATLGQTSGWKTFLDAGVNLWQSDLPALLIPVMEEYNQTGVFPETVEN